MLKRNTLEGREAFSDSGDGAVVIVLERISTGVNRPGDSQGAESLIQSAGWGMEASMHGSASLDGFACAAFGRD